MLPVAPEEVLGEVVLEPAPASVPADGLSVVVDLLSEPLVLGVVVFESVDFGVVVAGVEEDGEDAPEPVAGLEGEEDPVSELFGAGAVVGTLDFSCVFAPAGDSLVLPEHPVIMPNAATAPRMTIRPFFICIRSFLSWKPVFCLT
jgi:hypothetical protein